MLDIRYKDEIGLIFTLTGEFSFGEVETAIRDLLHDPEFEKIGYWLIDRSGAVGYNMTPPQLKTLVSICQTLSLKNRELVHIFVSGSDLQYGMARMSEAYEMDTGWKILNFRDLESAEKWILQNITR